MFKRSLITYLITFLCLVTVFGINLGLALLRDFLVDRAEESGQNSGIYILVLLIGVASSLVVAINNWVLSLVIRRVSIYEGHDTYTYLNLSIALKETFSMFINTGVIPILVNLGRNNWFGYGDLSIDILFIMFAINFVSPTLSILDVVHFWRKFRIWFEKKKGKESLMTQREANELSEGTEMDLSRLYAGTMLVFFMTAFYTPLIPLLPVISFFGLVYKYWVEKIILLRRNKLPEQFAEQMALNFSNLVPLC